MGAEPADRMGNEGGRELANRARNEEIKSDRWHFYATLAESMTSDDDARPAAPLDVNTEHTLCTLIMIITRPNCTLGANTNTVLCREFPGIVQLNDEWTTA